MIVSKYPVLILKPQRYEIIIYYLCFLTQKAAPITIKAALLYLQLQFVGA